MTSAHEESARELAEKISTNTDALSNDRIRDEGVRMITEAITTSYAAGMEEAAKMCHQTAKILAEDEKTQMFAPGATQCGVGITYYVRNALTPPAAKVGE